MRAPIALLIGMMGFLASQETQPPLFSLQECINQALDKNPTILKVKEEIAKTKGLRLEARSGALPQAKVGTNIQTEDKRRFGVPFGPEQNEDSWGVSLRVTQALYEGGKLSAAMDAAKLIEEAAFQNVQNQIDETILAVRKNYYNAIRQHDLIIVSEKSVQLLGEEVSQQQKKLKAGTATKFNVLRAEVELANAKPPLIRAKNNYRIAIAELAKVMGYPLPSNLKQMPFQIETGFPDQNNEIAVESLIERSMQNRPELKSITFQIQSKEKQLKIDRAGALPSLSVFGGYDFMSDRYKKDLDESNEGYIFGLQGEWRIFDGLESKGKMEQTRATMRQLKYEWDEKKSAIEVEVRRSYSSYLEAQELLASQQKNVESAEESLRLAKVRQDAGAGLQLDTLSSQVALTQARTNELEAKYDLAVALSEMERATGIKIVVLDSNSNPLPSVKKPEESSVDPLPEAVPRAEPMISRPELPKLSSESEGNPKTEAPTP